MSTQRSLSYLLPLTFFFCINVRENRSLSISATLESSYETFYSKSLHKVIFTYVRSRKEELKLEDSQKSFFLFDVFKRQKTQSVIDLVEGSSCISVFVSANFTHYFQPLGLAINAKAKRFLNDKFEAWYSGESTKWLNEGSNVNAIDIKYIYIRYQFKFVRHEANPRPLAHGFL